MADLIINGKDALSEFGARMDRGFLDALLAPAPLKSFVSNKSRLEDGKRVVVANPRVDERDVTLNMTIQGTSERDFLAKKDALFTELIKGPVDIQVPSVGNDVYHLIYHGKAATYAMNRAHTFAKLTIKLNEPNPANRV